MINETKCTATTGVALANLSKNQDRMSVGHSDINNQNNRWQLFVVASRVGPTKVFRLLS